MADPSIPKLKFDDMIRSAIEQKRLLRVIYKEKDRIVEPHDYGIHNGLPKLLSFQVAGKSSERLSNWRWIETALISEIEMLETTFAGGRHSPSGSHHKWDQLFARVEPASADSGGKSSKRKREPKSRRAAQG